MQVKGSISSYLATLQELRLVSYQQPILSGTTRRGVWTMDDPYLRFWFRFVHAHRGQLEHEPDPAAFYTRIVEPALDEFVSRPTFEELCREYVRIRVARGTLASRGTEVGAWWGPVPAPRPDNPRFQAEGEVDVVGADRKRVVLAGEAKWANAPVGLRELEHLRSAARCIPGYGDGVRWLLFSRSFDPRLQEEDVELVTPDRLYAD